MRPQREIRERVALLDGWRTSPDKAEASFRAIQHQALESCVDASEEAVVARTLVDLGVGLGLGLAGDEESATLIFARISERLWAVELDLLALRALSAAKGNQTSLEMIELIDEIALELGAGSLRREATQARGT